MYRIIPLFKTSGFVLILMIFASACSKKKDTPELRGKLEIGALEDPVIVGQELVFEVSANGKSVQGAQVLINGLAISGTKHTFDKTGSYQIQAKNENYQDSEIMEIDVKRIQTNVYVVGRVGRKGTLWKNGKAQAVPNAGGASRALSVYVKDGQVVISGQGDSDAKANPMVWIDGKPRSLSSGDGIAESVFADGKDVYTAGTMTNNRDYTPTIWKNNEATILPYDGEYAYAYSAFVSEGDVYVAGMGKLLNKYVYEALVWKNGKLQTLTHEGKSTQALDIFVDGTDVYAAGNSEGGANSKAILWTNGVAKRMTKSSGRSNAVSVVVRNGDVFVSGFESAGTYEVPRLWKNGAVQELEHGSHDTWGYDLFVTDKDVYVVGEAYVDGKSKAVLWKNGKQEILSADASEDAYANAIFVEELLVE